MVLNRRWSLVYEKAIRDDGSLFFPERLSNEFLENARRTMGTYLFANQYQNEVIPEGSAPFKKDWFLYYKDLPSLTLNFGFIDPAISQEDGADYTGIVVVAVDKEQNWYVRLAQRRRMTPTQIVEACFALTENFGLKALGIETVAYQKALLYMLNETMRQRKKMLPVTGINHGADNSKEMRIMGLIPRFEWGRIHLAQGLDDLEMELLQFPRASHDDIIDSLASIEPIIYYPTVKERKSNEPPHPSSPGYENWYIKNTYRRRNEGA